MIHEQFIGELQKDKTLKEVKLVDKLLKYKQNQVYVP